MNKEDPIVIIGSARTPIGAMLGAFSEISAVNLGAAAIQTALERANLDPKEIEEVLMGCVLSAGQGQAPARQAALNSVIPESVPCSTINKVCGSGMKTVMLAHDLLKLGEHRFVVAGGMENMSRAPYLLDKARQGYRQGHGEIKDHMFLDGLEDAYETGKLMGVFAERTAEKYGFSRQMQDEFATRSLLRAQEAIRSGWFLNKFEITPLTINVGKNQTRQIQEDEKPTKVTPDKIPHLKPSFKENGSVTAANSAGISDGAAALILTRESIAKQYHLKPLARILGHSSVAKAPAWFTITPQAAIQNLLHKINWKIEDVELFEINEAFAVVVLGAMKDLGLSHDIVNVQGGACALGHPIGASGTRIICTLLGAMERLNKTRGIAAICIGGGEGTAIAIERIPS